jgi:gliding motility-associated-like protein
MSNGTTQSGSNTTFTECLTNETSNTQFYDVALTVTTAQGCQNTYLETDYVLVYAQPVASFYFEPDAPTTLDSEVDFVNTSDNAENYSWDFAGLGVSSSINPTFEFPEEAETYSVQLIAFTNEGCADTTRMDVEIFEDIIFYVPNTFTPDGNSYNEVFQPIFYSGFDPQDYKLLIYNRWGEVLYESNDASIGWDGTYGGKRVKEGTYIWKIEFKEKLTDERQNHTGHVNVLR